MEGKIVYINLSNQEIKVKKITQEMRNLYLGGRGLDMYLLYNHLEGGEDPLSEDNVLLVSAGPLVGTLASASARTHIGGKSPLTGGVGSSNIGGFFGPELRWAGYDHLVIKGEASLPVYIYIKDEKIEIKDASHLWGMGAWEVQEAIKKEVKDPETQILSIGIAGENKVRFANVRTGVKNSAGRTGMGAVMGAKKLKAIAVRGSGEIEIADPEEALRYNEEIINKIVNTKFGKIMQKWGTMFIFGVTNSTGLIRVKNFQTNWLTDSENVECENIEKVSIGNAGCFGCQLHCRHKYVIREGKYKGVYAEGPEYTSQGAWAAEVGCRDFNTILVGNHLVNHYGLDTLEVGSLIAWAMELYEEGILTKKDTQGLELKFGNHTAVIEMIHRIAKREGLGDILAEGPLRASKIIGKGAEKYCIQVKGMSNLHSDERMTPALALGIATATRGSDHLRSRPAIDLYHLPEEVLRKIYNYPTKYEGKLSSDYRSYTGKARMVEWQEILYEVVDSLGVCKFHTIFLSPNLIGFEELAKLLEYNTRMKKSAKELWEIGERAYTIERMFNIREGFGRKDDMLVWRYFEEPTKGGLKVVRGKKLDRDKFEKMLNEYYKLHGWDKNGVPTKETLKRLKLEKEPSHKL